MQAYRHRGAVAPVPLYFQVQQAIEAEITSGQLKPGDLLPTERILAGRYGVSSITIRRALGELVERGLIYRENGVGTFVASQTRKLRILLLLHGFAEEQWHVQSQMFGALIGSIGQVVWEHGSVFSLTHVLVEEPLLSMLSNIVDQRSFDGVLLRTAGDPPTRAVDLLAASGTPYVVVKKRVPERPTNSVVLDNRRSAHLATAHLLESGHRRIACIVGPRESTTFRDRVVGYTEGLRSAGLDRAAELVRYGRTAFEEAGYEETQALLDLPAPPTAILVGDDLMVQGVYQAVKERGLRIPADVALVGFDEVGLGPRYDPPLTALGPSDYDLGRESARLLMRLIAGEAESPTEVVLEPTLTIRGSSRSTSDP